MMIGKAAGRISGSEILCSAVNPDGVQGERGNAQQWDGWQTATGARYGVSQRANRGNNPILLRKQMKYLVKGNTEFGTARNGTRIITKVTQDLKL
jgi:hypothetical protein